MQSGDQVDGYTILRLIGRGGYGEVWLCRADALGDYRALKFIPSTSPEVLEKEFEALASYRKAAVKLRSAHLMPIEHVGRRGEGLYYVMPLADGSGDDPLDPAWRPLTLASIIEERFRSESWFTSQEIAAWICPVLDALQVVSEAALVHRDVKPDNILVFGGQPVVGDISLLGEDRGTLTRRGTPGFATPSWYEGGHADMYGAAATLYTLLTGNPPDRMGRTVFNAPPQGEARLLPEERAGRRRLHAVIRRATDERVSERYPDFAAMAAAIRGLPLPPPRRSARGWRRLALAGLSLAAAGAVLAWSRDSLEFVERAIRWPVARMGSLGWSVSAVAPRKATRERPFVNSLGMKFVPVPGTSVLFCVHETRWKDYLAYAKDNPGIPREWWTQVYDGFRLPEPAVDHPVLQVTWEEASSFCKWLSKKEGREYRLPRDWEWSLAVGLAGKENGQPGLAPENVVKDRAQFPWGTDWPPPPGAGNYSDESHRLKAPNPKSVYLSGYDDGYPTSAPVMRFAPNPLGIFDLGGNAWEWVEDWWNPAQTERIMRGGGWTHGVPDNMLSAWRARVTPDFEHQGTGFRVVLAVQEDTPQTAPPPTVLAPLPAAGEKELLPFVNSLGMKLVPVPGAEVLFCIHETRWRDYARYAKESLSVPTQWASQSVSGFLPEERPGDHPVVNVTWEDAKGFCAWLSMREKRRYRLPWDHEWSLAAGIGDREDPALPPEAKSGRLPGYPWGPDYPPPHGWGNYSDLSRKTRAPGLNTGYVEGYQDGFPTTAPVMSFSPNSCGLYDLSGNVQEWIGDKPVCRGGSWYDHGLTLQFSARTGLLDGVRNLGIGFRVVCEAEEPVSAVRPGT